LGLRGLFWGEVYRLTFIFNTLPARPTSSEWSLSLSFPHFLLFICLITVYQLYINRSGYTAIVNYWEGSVRGLFQDTLGYLPEVSRGTEKDDASSEILRIVGSRKYSEF
jgi:hypothetical protein